MILRLPWTAVAFVSALGLGENAGHLPPSNSENAAVKNISSATTEIPTKSHKTVNRSKEISAMIVNFESGERRAETIQHELASIAGETTPVRWSGENIKGPYKLTQIISHVQNLDNNFELLFLHTLQDRDTEEDTVTHYTNRIHEADEKNIGGSIVFSRVIENQDGKPVFDRQSRAQYFFKLKRDALSGNFRLRQPEGMYTMSAVREGAFDPLSILNKEDGTFDEVGDYQYELFVGGTPYIIRVVPRLTELETLTIEVEFRPVNSLITNTFILVYEKI